MTKIEFDAIRSDDHNEVCYDVDEKAWEAVYGRKPDSCDSSYHNSGLFRLYLADLFEEKRVLRITFERGSGGTVITIKD